MPDWQWVEGAGEQRDLWDAVGLFLFAQREERRRREKIITSKGK